MMDASSCLYRRTKNPQFFPCHRHHGRLSVYDSHDRDHAMKSNISHLWKNHEGWNNLPFFSTARFRFNSSPLGQEGCHYHESSRTHSAFSAVAWTRALENWWHVVGESLDEPPRHIIDTPPKTNMAPQNGSLEDVSPIPRVYFQVPAVKLRGCSHKATTLLGLITHPPSSRHFWVTMIFRLLSRSVGPMFFFVPWRALTWEDFVSIISTFVWSRF